MIKSVPKLTKRCKLPPMMIIGPNWDLLLAVRDFGLDNMIVIKFPGVVLLGIQQL